MAIINLDTYICGQFAGVLAQDAAGLTSFRYDDEYTGAPLSLCMPIKNRPYSHNVVAPYLFGLLPDSERQRRAIALEYGESPNNPVALLSHIGLDCPGGVQFIPSEGTLRAELTQCSEPSYKPLNEHEIALKLKSIRDNQDASWMGSHESWSLGGNQGKFALYSQNGSWCECEGTAPTTHIFKNGVRGYKLEALNEFVCMKCAQYCGIPTAQVNFLEFEDEQALVIARYDRVNAAGNKLQRLHQEDLCQALGFMPSQKYTSDGGPTTAQVQMLLARTSESLINLEDFTRMLFYNVLIGAPDAHAKNYSLLLGEGGTALLAPMYDVASGLAYESLRRCGRLAMSVGGENRFGRVGRGAIERYAGSGNPKLKELLEKNFLTADACINIMSRLAEDVPSAMAEIFDDYAGMSGIDELREHILAPVVENCKATLALL